MCIRDSICVDEMGVLIKPDYISAAFPKLLDRHGLRRIRFHDLQMCIRDSYKALVSGTYDKRAATTEEVAYLILFYASPWASRCV